MPSVTLYSLGGTLLLYIRPPPTPKTPATTGIWALLGIFRGGV